MTEPRPHSEPSPAAESALDLAQALKEQARMLGFDACRITDASPPASAPHLRDAIKEGRHAEMAWLARNADQRADPQRVLPGAHSIITLAVSYAGDEPSPIPSTGQAPALGVVARYARSLDYHHVLRPPLVALTDWLDARAGTTTRSLWYVDTGPILERDLAQRAGIGFVGRHTGLVSRELGNWFLLAEILTTAGLPPDPPARNLCGRCTRCLDACPTGALPAPFTLDARRCISYLTIEHKGSIPEDLRPLLGDRIFGCDDCLAACPWNRFARSASLLAPHRREAWGRPKLLDWLALDDTGFRQLFAGTPMARTKRRGLLRNVCVALGNVGDEAALPALSRAANDPEPLVAEHAAWAIQTIESRRQQVPPTSLFRSNGSQGVSNPAAEE
jgi:epoxyqueuosine reductase